MQSRIREEGSEKSGLDDQLFASFSRRRDLLRRPPEQAKSRAHLRELHSVAAGGLVFTTQVLPGREGRPAPSLVLPARHRG